MGIWQQRLSAIADGSLPLPLVTQILGLGRLKRWSEGYVEKEWKVDPGFCTGEGTEHQVLFGGYLAALADKILTFAAMTVMDDDHYFRTADLRVSFSARLPTAWYGLKDGRSTVAGASSTLRPSSIATTESGRRKPQPFSWSCR